MINEIGEDFDDNVITLYHEKVSETWNPKIADTQNLEYYEVDERGNLSPMDMCASYPENVCVQKLAESSPEKIYMEKLCQLASKKSVKDEPQTEQTTFVTVPRRIWNIKVRMGIS